MHGGTSGIGVTAIQLAREFGARVYATAGSDEKCAPASRSAPTPRSTTAPPTSPTALMELTGGAGVNVVLDIVGAPYFERNLRCLAIDGRLVQVSTMLGSKVERFDLFKVMQKRLVITGSTMRPRSTAEKGAIAQALKERVWPVLNAGRCGRCLRDLPARRGRGRAPADGVERAHRQDHAEGGRLKAARAAHSIVSAV